MLDVYEVAAIVSLFGEKGSDVEHSSVVPSVDYPLADIYVSPFFKSFFLLQLHSRVKHEQERAEEGLRIAFCVVVSVLKSNLAELR